MPPADDNRLSQAFVTLQGLTVGDAFGQQFFLQPDLAAERIAARTLPIAPWPFTDDTQMARSVVAVLQRAGTIDQE
jgi:hypothetical protein